MDSKFKKECEVCGKHSDRMYLKGNKFGQILCKRHYLQLWRHGKISGDYDDIYIVENNYVLIKVVNSRTGKITAYSKIDENDLGLIRQYKWHLTSNGYLATRTNYKIMFLHQLFLDYDTTRYECDHINRDKLDNRRSNIQIITNQENSRNKGPNKNNRTGRKGITLFIKRKKKYMARIMHNGKNIYLGYFMNLEDAIKARKEGELKYWGKIYD